MCMCVLDKRIGGVCVGVWRAALLLIIKRMRSLKPHDSEKNIREY